MYVIYIHKILNAYFLLKRTTSVYGTTLTAAELIAKLAEIHPALAQAAYIVRGSVSSGVHRVGDAPAEGKGFHVYFPVLDASDIPRYGALLFDRLWLAGWGFCVLSACGSVLLRGPIDAAVFSPERLDFVASPIIVGEGLTYTKPDATFKEGGYLDTRSLPDLSTEEVTEVARLQAAAKLAIKPEGERKAKVWGDARVSEMVGRGSSREQAEATVKRVLAGGVSALTAEFVLRFANGDVATVSEVLANPEKFDKKALADPVEGVSYGATTAKFYWNEGKPFINSNAHGGCKYALADVELDDANSVIDRLSRLSLLEYEMQRVDAAKCLGIRVGSLDDLVDHARYANAPAAPGDNEPFTVPPPWPEPVNGGMWSTGGCSTIGLCRCR
jgi:hypothetical protein